MLAAGFALAASVAWGFGDFIGGVKSRSLDVITVLIVAEPIGLGLLAIWVAVRGEGPPGPEVLWACISAVLGTLGLIAFFRGMATGALSVVVPIAGAGAVIPVVWGLATGDHPSRWQEIGFAAALVGVVLASLERRPQSTRLAAGAGWAVVAMVAFGGYYVPMHAASAHDYLWPAFVFRVTSVALLALIWLVVRPGPARRSDLPALAAVGVLDTGGNVLFAAASQHGLVSVVSVLASLYPIVTVLLARAVLHERVDRSQEVGIVLALAGIVLVSAG